MDKQKISPYAETKAWLSRATTIEMEVKALMAARKRAYDMATSAVGRMDATPVKSSGGDRPIDKLVQYDEEIDRAIDRLVDTKAEIFRVIQRVPDGVLRTLLIEYYINGRTWEETAEKMEKSETNLRRYKKDEAIAAVSKILQAEKKI